MPHNRRDDEIFSTRDLTLAATLITLKFPLQDIDYQIIGTKNNPVGFFNFKNSQDLQDAQRKFIQGLLSVEPRTFSANVRSLKGEVTNTFTNPRKGVI